MSHINQWGDGASIETRTVTIHQEFVEIEGPPWCFVGNGGWESCVMVFFTCGLVKYETTINQVFFGTRDENCIE